MSQERKAKSMVAGGAGIFVIAVIIMLLFVLPANRAGSPSVEAQPPAGGPPAIPGYRQPRDSTAMGAPPGMPGVGGMPGAPGMRAVPGMPGVPGIMPGMLPGVMAAAPPSTEFKGPALESPRDNPFAPPGIELDLALAAATQYGPDWSRIPVTTRVGFVRPERPPRPIPPAPPPPTAKRFLRISSMMWSEGRPIATYETAAGKTGTIQPGDWVEEWQVIEMGQDYVIVENRDTGEIQRVFLKGK